MNSRNIVIGALAGLAVGTLVGALYSSNTATDLRGEALKKGKAYSKGLKKMFNQFLDSLNDRIDTAGDEATGLIKKGKSESARAKEKIESMLN